MHEGSVIALQIRNEIFNNLGFTSSAGIAKNKTLAKLASKINKPNNQTCILNSASQEYIGNLPLNSIPGFKKRVREFANQLQVLLVKELLEFSEDNLSKKYGNDIANWLCNISKGVDNEAVLPKGPPKTLSASMSLIPIYNDYVQVERILGLVCADLIDKLCRDNMRFHRQANTFILHLRNVDSTETSKSISMGKIMQHGSDGDTLLKSMVNISMNLFKDIQGKSNFVLRWISASATKFEPISNNASILKFVSKSTEKKEEINNLVIEEEKTITTPTPVIVPASVIIKAIPYSPIQSNVKRKEAPNLTLDKFFKKARSDE